MKPVWIALCAALALGQEKKEIEIKGDTAWTDTGLDIRAGDRLRITASGKLAYGASAAGPDGLARGFRDLLRIFPYNEAGRGALLGRIGDGDATRPFLAGARRESQATTTGRLFLGINQGGSDRGEGAFQVTIEVTRGAATPAIEDLKLEPVTQALLDQVPLRVADPDGTPGDRVNFLIVGSEDRVTRALEAAGWVQVDRDVKGAVLRGVLASVSKQAYTTLPMSVLHLFGRPQDYGYAQGDPIRVVAARHHFRIWKAPFELDGQTVWAGAGTHDIGFDRDRRNNKLTHRIDSDVDKERDYIGRSLQTTGQVARLDYVTASNPLKKARTAHGQEFFSDGRTLVIHLQPDFSNFSAAFA
ncbi:MAG: LssY C-terminal domain-containing protein, partial [Bryobacteraceae bacterium]